ncbi:hypothetical protein F4677DRAFT_193475 [Hypoxylon crocopeplum]|nr:hypothetical protein F4677DRAFT_193475 [Hypoxylon crocopeplum]
MAEPENFEDDLFADLYDDNEAPAASAPSAPAAAQAPAPAPAPAPLKPQPSIEPPSRPDFEQLFGHVVPTAEEIGYGDDYQDENYDDDDDVDFNLGNGPATISEGAQQQHDESASAFHTTRGPSSKEDG